MLNLGKKHKNTQNTCSAIKIQTNKKTQKHTKHKKHIWSFPATQRATYDKNTENTCLNVLEKHKQNKGVTNKIKFTHNIEKYNKRGKIQKK